MAVANDLASFLKKDITVSSVIDLLRKLGVRRAYTLYRFGFGIKKRQEFYRDLASVIRSGIRLESAIADMRHAKAAPDFILKTVMSRLQRGDDLSRALDGLVPDAERMILRAGEEGADKDGLRKSLTILADAIGQMKRGQGAFFKATAYPLTILTGVVGFIVFYAKKMLPGFTSQHMLDVSRLHGSARFEYDFFLTISQYWYLVPLIVLGGLFAIYWSLGHEFPFRDKLDNFPPWSIYRLWVGTQFLFALAALMRAGVPAAKALSILQTHATPYLAKRLRHIKSGLSRGETLARSMEKSPVEFPERIIIARLRIREDHSDVVSALDEFSKDWAERGDAMIASRTAVLNAFLMILASVLMTLAGVGPYAFEAQSGQQGF